MFRKTFCLFLAVVLFGTALAGAQTVEPLRTAPAAIADSIREAARTDATGSSAQRAAASRRSTSRTAWTPLHRPMVRLCPSAGADLR